LSRNQIKFKFSVKELSFEFEGDVEKGERIQRGIQDSLGKLLDTPSRVLPPSNKGDVIDAEIVTNGQRDDSPPASDAQEPRRGTRKPNRPRGTTAGARLKALISEGFFAQERALPDIQESLAHKGFNFEAREISAAILPLVQKELLDRRQNDKGNYVYFDKVRIDGQGGNGTASEPVV
jgi:hypothetical protein